MIFLRYCLIGGFATSVHYVILLVMVEALRIQPFFATAMGAIVGAFVAYIGNRKFTFLSDVKHQMALPRFLMVAAFGATVNYVLVKVGTQQLHLYYWIPQVVATLVVLLCTYYFNRVWTFYDVN